ncbi:MAG TPA: hypothetical protein VNU46_06855 [Gemmatimonadaceae bacterium]|jgi:hypothetical protein|nr:hypothetical protein [Gemmatimonadaceae bacterium]
MAQESLWVLYHLRESPFFQEPLQGGSTPRYPLDLFVAREPEVSRYLAWIAAHRNGSRQSIRGPVGVGKSTLAHVIKARARDQFRLLSHPDAISVSTSDSTDELLVRILRYTLNALFTAVTDGAADTVFKDVESVQEARRLVLQYRETTSVGGGLSILGFGGSGSRSTATHLPSQAMPRMLVPSLLVNLRKVAVSQLGVDGFIIHLNNLENLSDAQEQTAPLVVRDLRDLLLEEGLHWLLVGTDDALRIIVDAQPQVRGIFPPPRSLAPLTTDDVMTILQRRYDALRVDTSQPAIPPIESEGIRTVYDLYEGDLRGTFSALDMVATELLGLSDRGVHSPLGHDEVLRVLHNTVRESLEAQLPSDALAILRKLAAAFPTDVFIQSEAQHVTGDSPANISHSVRFLMGRGMIYEVGTRPAKGRGRRATEYRVARLATLAYGPPEESIVDVE